MTKTIIVTCLVSVFSIYAQTPASQGPSPQLYAKLNNHWGPRTKIIYCGDGRSKDTSTLITIATLLKPGQIVTATNNGVVIIKAPYAGCVVSQQVLQAWQEPWVVKSNLPVAKPKAGQEVTWFIVSPDNSINFRYTRISGVKKDTLTLDGVNPGQMMCGAPVYTNDSKESTPRLIAVNDCKQDKLILASQVIR